MLLFQYLDALPAIPIELLRDPVVPEIAITFRANIDANYTRWGIRDDLRDWLRVNITENLALAGLQTMTWPDGHDQQKDVLPHCDRRNWAVNFVIESGGPAVTTSFYLEPGQSTYRPAGCRIDDFGKLIQVWSGVIETGRWHIINTRVLHGVENIVTQRRAVTIGINTANPFADIHGYAGLVSV
jgi:hypothetical protein